MSKKKKSMIFNNGGMPQANQPAAVTLDTDVQNAISGVQTRIGEQIDGVQNSVNDLTSQVQNANDSINDLEQRVASIDSVSHGHERDPMGGYNNHAEFLCDVMAAQRGETPERLQRFAAAGSDEQSTFSNPDGGFLIPEAMLGEVLSTDPFAIQPDTGLSTRRVPMGAQVVHVNARVDKNHSESVTGGFRVYRRAEASSVSSSKSNYEQIKLSAEALMGLAYATDEILQRSPQSFAALISAGFETEYRSKLNEERVRGTGAGEYMGFLNSPSLITVDKESGQAADTITGNNIRAMRKRAWNYGQCVWMVNQDTYEQLSSAHYPLTNDDVKIFTAGNGVDVPDTILGRPVVYDENMSTLGRKGDIALVNWNEYLEGFLGGIQQASSVHVRFVENETAFKFNVYCDGQPWWRTALTPKNSAVTMSPFVTLAERA